MSEFEPLDLFDKGIDDLVETTQAPMEEQVPEEQTVPSGEQPQADSPKQEMAAEAVPEEAPVQTPESAAAQSEELPPPSPTLEQVLEAANHISQQLSALNDSFQARIMYSAHEEKIVDQMHRELQKYKEDLYAQLVRPILLDIISIRESIMQVGAVYRAKPEGEQNIPNKTFSSYEYDLQDILERNNVEIYRSQAGDPFVPLRQKAGKKVPSADQSLHGKIAESVSCGYSYNGRTIFPEKVTLYYYEAPAEHEEKSEVSENG